MAKKSQVKTRSRTKKGPIRRAYAGANMPTPINIHVHENDQANGEKQGTFTEPHPKVKLNPNTAVNFNLLNAGATFAVRFTGFKSPFTSGELDISDGGNRTIDPAASGVYHYAVKVTKGGNVYTISNCPEFEVP
jgi:hypothetical protein